MNIGAGVSCKVHGLSVLYHGSLGWCASPVGGLPDLHIRLLSVPKSTTLPRGPDGLGTPSLSSTL